MHFLPDMSSLEKTLESLSGLTGLHFSLFDGKLKQVIAPHEADMLLSFFKTHKRGHDLYKGFIEENGRLVLQRKQPSLIQGPTAQYHLLIPIRYKDLTFLSVAEAFYASADDFRRFCKEHASEFGFAGKSIEQCGKDLVVTPVRVMEGRINNIRLLIETALVSACEKGELQRESQWSKTMMSFMENAQATDSTEDVCRTILRVVMFLFQTDTAAVFSEMNGSFCPRIVEGRAKEAVQGLKLTRTEKSIAQAFAAGEPLVLQDGHDLRHIGFSDEIRSASLFPLSSELGFQGFLGVFNSLLEKDAFQNLQRFCRLSSRLCGLLSLQKRYENQSSSLRMISERLVNLQGLYKDASILYDGIVSDASTLAEAERCSLMLPEQDREILRVNAVRGYNKWLLDGIRIRRGEGIAGRVYETGAPVVIDSEEKIRTFALTPRSHYKTTSSLSLPLKMSDEVIGILNLSDKCSGEAFSPKDLTMLTQFTEQASVLLKLNECYRTSEEMRELSMIDSLTAIFNRRYFNNRLEEEYKRARRYGIFFSLGIVDIDDFKLFNDTEGHPAGDEILRGLATIMTGAIRTNDILARIGGEEFAIIMPQTTASEAFILAERMRGNIKKLVRPSWRHFPKDCLTVSIGLATYPECGEPLENIIRKADRALYRAKMQGKDCTVISTESAVSRYNPRSAEIDNDRQIGYS